MEQVASHGGWSRDLVDQCTVNSEIIQTRPFYRRLIPMSDGLKVSDPSPRDDRMETTTTSPDRTFKVVFAGDAAVGKSCFIYRFCRGVFINNLGSTLGVDFQVKTIGVDGKKVALQLWDTAGQERFRSMTKTYFRRADGVVLLYDVTNERSFLNVRQWIENIKLLAKCIKSFECGDWHSEYEDEVGVQMDNVNVRVLLYTNAVVLMAEKESDLQEMIFSLV
uniref:Uncharacterized protein n=1 Tax=Timema cristinae TaxID=61476 RepID=A0A7R9GX81_TIMCR|nr:unnamed protein product [Timema cristinae]